MLNFGLHTHALLKWNKCTFDLPFKGMLRVTNFTGRDLYKYAL